MRVRSERRLIVRDDMRHPLAATHRRAGIRSVIGGMLGVPLVVLSAMALLLVLDEHPIGSPGQQIALSRAGGGSGTAVVYGAGTGIHFRSVANAGAPISADLSRGALHVLSLAPIQLDAREVAGRHVSLRGNGRLVRLESEAKSIRITAGF